MRLENFAIPDYGDFFSSIGGGPSVAGHATFDIRWLGGGGRNTVRDATNGFEEQLVEGAAVIRWTASNDNGYRYTAGSPDDSNTVYAAVGHERNGSFFR